MNPVRKVPSPQRRRVRRGSAEVEWEPRILSAPPLRTLRLCGETGFLNRTFQENSWLTVYLGAYALPLAVLIRKRSSQFEFLHMLRNFHRPAELLDDLRFEGFRGVRFAMHQKNLLRCPFESSEPAQNLTIIGMGREILQRFDLGLDRNHFAEDSDLLLTVDQAPPAGPFGLIADEDHGIAPIRQSLPQMME